MRVPPRGMHLLKLYRSLAAPFEVEKQSPAWVVEAQEVCWQLLLQLAPEQLLSLLFSQPFLLYVPPFLVAIPFHAVVFW